MQMFDDKGNLRFDAFVESLDSYKAIMKDGRVTEATLMAQSERVVESLSRIDKEMDEKDKALAIQAIGEMAVLQRIYAIMKKEES